MRVRRFVGIVGIVVGLSAGVALTAPRFSDWSVPQPLTAVNSSLLEFPNFISRDGLSLYLQRGTGLAVAEDLWVSRRQTKESPWGAPERLPDAVNSSANDRAAAISPDGHWLFFGSDRPGGEGGFDIWAAWRADVHDDFAWQAPVNLGTPVNTGAMETGPMFFKDRRTHTIQMYFVSTRSGGLGAQDIYMSIWNRDGSFSPPELVVELSSPASDQRPYIGRDGLEIVVHSNRPGTLGGFDIWVATRERTDDPWSTPENPPSLNSTSEDVAGVLSWDGRTFFLGSNRGGGDGGDVYFATRARVRGHDGDQGEED